MISEAIQEALESVIENTYQTIGDENITTPFCVHEESDEPIRLKEGIVGYEYKVEVAIIDTTPDSCIELASSGVSVIMALENTTSHGTRIEGISYDGSNPGFDQQTKEYIRILQFTIQTGNL